MQTPKSGPLAGMSRDQLTAMLASAQEAYTELLMGKKGVSFSYSQGDGTRSVTYQATTVANITMLISQLQKALGIVQRGRRPIRFRY